MPNIQVIAEINNLLDADTTAIAKTALGVLGAATKGDASIVAADLAAGAVTEAKIAANAVIEAKILDGAVTAGKIGTSAVTDAKLAANAVTTDKILAGAVTFAKTTGVQASLVSGTNIRTVNGNTLLGSTDLVISGGGAPTNAQVNTAIAADPFETRKNLQSPKIGIAGGSSIGGKFLSESTQIMPQIRALYFGDSICYPPDEVFRSLMGSGGKMLSGTQSTLAGGAVAQLSPQFAKSFNGQWVNLATGTATYHALNASTEGFAVGRQIQVWFWSETGGGTFNVGFDVTTGGTGTFTTLTSSNSTIGGTATINGATGVVDAAEGAAGALRLLTFQLANPEMLRIRITGLSGSAKIVAVGAVEVPTSGARNSGFVGLNCAFAGTQPDQWDDITTPALTTLLEQWRPDFIYVRGYETLSQWQNEYNAFAQRILTIMPSVQFILVGMHVTADDNTNVLNAVDKFQQQWCDTYNGVFIPIRNRMGDIVWSIGNRIAGTAFYPAPNNTFTVTITGGVNSTGVITTSFDHTFSVGQYIRFETLTGGSNIKTGRAYRVLTTPATNTFTLADVDGTTPVALGSDISTGTLSFIDGTHLSLEGSNFVANLVMESLSQITLPTRFLDQMSDPLGGWQRRPIPPSRIQSESADKNWVFAGPSLKRKQISVSKINGGGSSTGYPISIGIGATVNSNGQEIGFISGSAFTGTGFGLAFDTNYAVLGDNVSQSTFRNLNASSATISDKLEVFNSNNGLVSLAVSTAGTTTAHKPLLVLRNNASTSSKGTAVAQVDAIGNLKFDSIGAGIVLKSSVHGRIGTGVVLASGVSTVVNATVTANTMVILTKTASGGGVTSNNYVVTKKTAVGDHVLYNTATVATSDLFTLSSHGFETGMQVSLSGTLPAANPALASATVYFVVKNDANTFKLATTLANASTTTPTVIDITATGTVNVLTSAFIITATDTTGTTVTTDISTHDWCLIERQ